MMVKIHKVKVKMSIRENFYHLDIVLNTKTLALGGIYLCQMFFCKVHKH